MRYGQGKSLVSKEKVLAAIEKISGFGVCEIMAVAYITPGYPDLVLYNPITDRIFQGSKGSIIYYTEDGPSVEYWVHDPIFGGNFFTYIRNGIVDGGLVVLGEL